MDKESIVQLDNTILRSIDIRRLIPDKASMAKQYNWSRWYLVPENQRDKRVMIIKRYRRENGKTIWERYPRDGYRHLNESDLTAFLTRINGERDAEYRRAEEAYKIKHEFITQTILDDFDKYIRDITTSDEMANSILNKVHKKFLHFFINVLKLADPLDWKEKQAVWGKALINKPEEEEHRLYFRGEGEGKTPDKALRSKRVVDDNVAAANRFMKWLHERNPRLFPLIVFAPVSKPVLKKHEAKRKMDNPNRPGIGKFVTPADWNKISSKLDRRIYPFVWLAYHLGLRRAETLGVKLEDVRKGHFHLQRQLESVPESGPKYGPPKNRKDRKIEFWFTTPAEVYRVIENLPSLMHPDTFTDRLTSAMRDIGLDYEMHDFRRTWITRALKTKPATDVRLGAGHASIETTMRYVMDDREMDDEPFLPEVG